MSEWQCPIERVPGPKRGDPIVGLHLGGKAVIAQGTLADVAAAMKRSEEEGKQWTSLWSLTGCRLVVKQGLVRSMWEALYTPRNDDLLEQRDAHDMVGA